MLNKFNIQRYSWLFRSNKSLQVLLKMAMGNL